MLKRAGLHQKSPVFPALLASAAHALCQWVEPAFLRVLLRFPAQQVLQRLPFHQPHGPRIHLRPSGARARYGLLPACAPFQPAAVPVERHQQRQTDHPAWRETRHLAPPRLHRQLVFVEARNKAPQLWRGQKTLHGWSSQPWKQTDAPSCCPARGPRPTLVRGPATH